VHAGFERPVDEPRAATSWSTFRRMSRQVSTRLSHRHRGRRPLIDTAGGDPSDDDALLASAAQIAATVADANASRYAGGRRARRQQPRPDECLAALRSLGRAGARRPSASTRCPSDLTVRSDTRWCVRSSAGHHPVRLAGPALRRATASSHGTLAHRNPSPALPHGAPPSHDSVREARDADCSTAVPPFAMLSFPPAKKPPRITVAFLVAGRFAQSRQGSR
jgi:hypothetical protein